MSVEVKREPFNPAMKKQLTITTFFILIIVISCIVHWNVKYSVYNYFTFTTLTSNGSTEVVTQGTAKVKAPGIIFIETTDKLEPSSLTACAVESAAHTYPNKTVNFYMKGIKTEVMEDQLHQYKTLQVLSTIKNVRILPLNFTSVFQDTPLLAWYKQENPERAQYAAHILADACRLVLLWKNGGIYFDTDIISLKPITVENFAAKQQQDSVNNAVLSFDEHHKFLNECLNVFVSHYIADRWGQQGPLLITRVLQKLCNLPLNNTKNDKCQEISVLNVKSFYPIHYSQWHRYYEVWNADEVIRESFGVHLWKYMDNKGEKVIIGSNTVVEKLFKDRCPDIYKLLSSKKT
ncbi:alpha-1,4-N-acetylglucosaminyltransferase-like [Latimeria chalumnae]|uniref:alpha-1,4-N-acetylglucosaminyltransferase-like n=1 Tax=Latimeria chalumnae TaxID=7897 RepID=UPI00313B2D7A